MSVRHSDGQRDSRLRGNDGGNGLPLNRPRRSGQESRLSKLSESKIRTRVDSKLPQFQQNTRRMVDLVAAIKNQEERIRQGGGAKAIAIMWPKIY